jgi:LPXTG-site transpeptidase (sortase) family protein
VLVVGLVLAISIPLGWALRTAPADAGTLPLEVVTATPLPADAGTLPLEVVTATPLPATATAVDAPQVQPLDGGSDAAAPVASRRPTRARGTAPQVSRPATRSARIADLEAQSAAAPGRLIIPSIGVRAPVVPIGVEDDGEMEVPADVRDVGWYRHGPAPGEPGATVIAGHVDSREQGAGAFFDLRKLKVGARVKVVDETGRTRHFDVVARRTYDKSRLPIDDLFAREGRSQLVLITCGGDFDTAARSYRSNVVVYAQPSS